MYFVEPPFVVGFFDYALGIRNRKRVVNELLIFSSVASNENNKPSENNKPTGKKEPKVWYSLKSHLNLDFSFTLWLFVSKAKRMNKNGFLASIPMAWRDCVFFFSRPPQFHVMDTFQRASMCAFFYPALDYYYFLPPSFMLRANVWKHLRHCQAIRYQFVIRWCLLGAGIYWRFTSLTDDSSTNQKYRMWFLVLSLKFMLCGLCESKMGLFCEKKNFFLKKNYIFWKKHLFWKKKSYE